MSTQQFVNACIESMRAKSFYDSYQKTFRILRADSNALRDIALRLRYDVYCRDNGISRDAAPASDNRPNNRPSNKNGDKNGAALEKDAYDDHALHYILYHKLTDEAAGTVRVVLPRKDKPLHSFPLQFVCDHPLLHMEDRVANFCEVSKLCMADSFRRRPGDGNTLPGYFDQDQTLKLDAGMTVTYRRVIPFAPLGLIRAAFEGALDEGLSDCLFMLGPEQLYALQKIGLSYRTLGPRIELNGPQQPVIFNIKHALDNMILQNPACWEVVSDRGRLHLKANAQVEDAWQDQLFDKDCMDIIFDNMHR